jgi:GT2 family glycosyltransferase
MKATVSIVIVNWNGGELLVKCLQHVERQTIRAQQVFVVDNASSDNSADSADGFSGVTVLRMKSNLGFAAGNNAALRLCDTDLVVLLNPDAFAEPDWLEHLLYAAENQPDVAAFGCRQMRYGAPGVLDGTGDCYLISGQVYRAGYGDLQRESDLQARDIFAVCAAAAMYRRAALVESGGFDEDFFCYMEDVDLGFRLRLLGHKAAYVPFAVVNHVGSATTGGQKSDFATYYGHRNLVWTFVKNMPGWLFWTLLPLHILLNLVSIALLSIQGRGGVAIRAKRDAVLGLGKMWGKRREIQHNRRVSVADIWQHLDKNL